MYLLNIYRNFNTVRWARKTFDSGKDREGFIMAKETKFIEVKPADVNSTIEKWGWFGWELMGQPQEIYNKSVHRTQETDKYYSSEYTTTTNYVKITFQREKSMPHYDELCKLEKEYDTPYSSSYYYPDDEPKLFGKFFIWLILPIILICTTSTITILFLLAVLSLPIIIIWRVKLHSKKKKEWNIKYEEYSEKSAKEVSEFQKKRTEIVNRAKSLLQ